VRPRLKTLGPRIKPLEQRPRGVAILSTSPARIRGRRLQEIRHAQFRENPLCQHCLDKGITRLATESDHIVPLWQGGPDTLENRQSLCADCHEAKTTAEAGRRAHG
jgi:5-methylcytosine-specific restriction protein A